MLFVLSLNVLAQNYPLVTIQDIQKVPDAQLGTDPPSVLNGDTVRVRGVVMARTVVDPTSNRNTIISAGSRWATYIQDPESGMWGGLYVLQSDTSVAAQATFFDLVDSADVVEFTGKVTEYYTTTELDLITKPQAIPVEILNKQPARPAPIELTLSDFFTEGGSYNFDAEKYESMYVIFRNVITSDRITGTATAGGNFKINDGLGHSVTVYNQSRYFKTNSLGLIPNYQPPLDGSVIEYVRGIINTRADGYYIVPVYPGDLGPVTQTPPIISSVKRDIGEVHPNDAVWVSCKIIDLDGTIQDAGLYYSVNGGSKTLVPMDFSASDSLYKAMIPGVSADSAIVDYYVWAKDNDNLESTAPMDTSKNNYFYLILNRPVTIQDVEYSPFGGSYSGYTNFTVTVTGVVVADTSDINNPAQVIIQNGTGPWSGIRINGTEVLKLKKGDNVTVTGTVVENFSVTNITGINSVSQYTINSSNNPLPEPQLISTADISNKISGTVSAEQWENVLVKYANVTVTDQNADANAGPNVSGNSNFGEILVADQSGVNTRVELQDGNNSYHNFWDASLENKPIRVVEGNKFDELIGIIYFSFSNYKLIPRTNADFVGYTTAVKEKQVNVPYQYKLEQNYPNPFNPSTRINYSIKNEGFVSLKVYNILGQQVANLVNEVKTPGNYSVNFNASDLSSGIYLYKIESNGFTQTKKMILVR